MLSLFVCFFFRFRYFIHLFFSPLIAALCVSRLPQWYLRPATSLLRFINEPSSNNRELFGVSVYVLLSQVGNTL